MATQFSFGLDLEVDVGGSFAGFNFLVVRDERHIPVQVYLVSCVTVMLLDVEFEDRRRHNSLLTSVLSQSNYINLLVAPIVILCGCFFLILDEK